MWLFFRISEFYQGCDPEIGAKDALDLLSERSLSFVLIKAIPGDAIANLLSCSRRTCCPTGIAFNGLVHRLLGIRQQGQCFGHLSLRLLDSATNARNDEAERSEPAVTGLCDCARNDEVEATTLCAATRRVRRRVTLSSRRQVLLTVRTRAAHSPALCRTPGR